MKKWQEINVGDVAPYWNGKIEAEELNKDNFISTDNMLENKGGIENSVYVPTSGKSTSYKPKDILISNIRPYFKKIWFADKIGGCSNDVIVFRSDNSLVDSKFMYYCLSDDNFFSHMMTGANGTKMPRGNKKSIPKYKIKLPPFITQKKITKILSNYDDLIENNLKRIKLLEEFARLTYEEWFLRFRIDGKKLELDQTTGLPLRWETVKVKSLVKKIKNTVKIKSSNILDMGENPVVDQSKNFISGYTNETNIHKYKGEPFIVFGDHTRILKFINFTFARGADGTQVIVSNNSRMPQTLFYHSLKALDLSNYHYARHFKFLKEEKIIIPEQKIAKKYNDMCIVIFEQIKNLRNQNNLLKEAVYLLLPRLMTGIIDTDDMDIAI